MPAPIPLYKGTQAAGTPVTAAEFANLAKIPIQVVYGDNIPKSPIPDLVADGRRAQEVTSRLFVQALNHKGGNASVLLLPDAGLYGNSHFMFSDLNNVAVADQMSAFLRAKGFGHALSRMAWFDERKSERACLEFRVYAAFLLAVSL